MVDRRERLHIEEHLGGLVGAELVRVDYWAARRAAFEGSAEVDVRDRYSIGEATFTLLYED